MLTSKEFYEQMAEFRKEEGYAQWKEDKRNEFIAIYCQHNSHIARRNSTKTDDFVIPEIDDAWKGWLAACEATIVESRYILGRNNMDKVLGREHLDSSLLLLREFKLDSASFDKILCKVILLTDRTDIHFNAVDVCKVIYDAIKKRGDYVESDLAGEPENIFEDPMNKRRWVYGQILAHAKLNHIHPAIVPWLNDLINMGFNEDYKHDSQGKAVRTDVKLESADNIEVSRYKKHIVIPEHDIKIKVHKKVEPK